MIPGLLLLLCIFVAAWPTGLPQFADVTPFLSLMAVYYWSIYRPELMPAIVVFAAGLVQDVVTGSPIGLMALVLILVHGVGVSQRRFFLGKSFSVEWWGFGLVTLAAAMVAWILASLYFVMLLDPKSIAVQALLTVAVYPLVTRLFTRASRALRVV
jgi:rod shape-determining protein MreD